MKIKLNVDLADKKTGGIIEIESKSGVAVDLYWRRRLNEAKFDNSIEIIENKKEKKDKPKKKKEKD